MVNYQKLYTGLFNAITDALEELDQALAIIVGDIGIRSSGLMRELDKVSSLIENASVAKEPQEDVDNPNEWIFKLLDDKSIDNEQKARMLLGLKE